METNFTEEKWLSVDKNFVYALRDIPWTKRGDRPEELGNVFSFKINDDNRLARIGEIEANVALILAAKQMFKALSNLVDKIDDVGGVTGWKDKEETDRVFASYEFDEARAVLKAATSPLK